MDGDGLVGGQCGNGLGIETGGEGPQTVDLIGSEATHRLDHVVLREVDEPLDLDGDAIAVEGRLGEMIDGVSGVFAGGTGKRSESRGCRGNGKGIRPNG